MIKVGLVGMTKTLGFVEVVGHGGTRVSYSRVRGARASLITSM